MNEVPILIINITLALLVAFFGGLVARRVGLPTIVGYLLAGIVIGPFTPGFVGDIGTIRQLAEMGVIFLMFGVGLHFSLHDLWRVRDIAVPGALIQMLLSTLLGFGLSRMWDWPLPAGIVLGLAISVASTVVLLRGLMDNSLLNTAHGQAAIGWVVMQDILSVIILVIMPVLSPDADGFQWTSLVWTLVKAAAFIVIMFFAGSRLIPWLLEHIAHFRSRELFILAVLAITLGTAMGASALFGISLALGAFMAGAIISQSRLSYQVGADLFAFREAFSVLFFVSIGMLVNPLFLWQHLGQVASLTTLVLFGQFFFVLLLGLFFPRPARTFLVIAVGLSQIGEFSFILGEGGIELGLLSENQYSLILAASLITITINPFMYRILPLLEKVLQRIPLFWKKLESNKPFPSFEEDQLSNHVVIIGYGRIGKHMVEVLNTLEIPQLVIESDVERIELLNQKNITTLYGDAANSEVITHAALDRARALVVTVPEETTTSTIVASARMMNPNLTMIVRAATEEGVHHLSNLGANHIVHPELEGGLEIVHHTLLSLGFPLREVHEYSESVRRDHYNITIDSSDEHRSLHDLLIATDSIEISWLVLNEGSTVVGKTLLEANIRSRTGTSVIAAMRNNQLIANPKSSFKFEAGDRIGLIGEKEQIETARKWLLANSLGAASGVISSTAVPSQPLNTG